MAFTESIKFDVKRKAHFKCCICESFEFVQVHHITPQVDGGPDTADNAAPLCVRCHDAYGANPEKRKWIREKRDFWFDFCEKKLYNEDINQLERVHRVIEKIHAEHEERLKNMENTFNSLQSEMAKLTLQNQNLVSSISQTPIERRPDIIAQIGSTASTISGAAIAMTHMTQLGQGVYANSTCRNCGSRIGLYVSNQAGLPVCPSCNTQMQ